MLKNKGEMGNALLLVLMVIVIFSVVGIGLITMNFSATKQFSKKEEQVQARHQAEMGVLHYKAGIDKAVNGYTPEVTKENGDLYTEEELVQKVCDKIKEITPPEIVKDTLEYHVKAKTGECNRGPYEELIYEFASIGRAGGAKKEIDAKIVVYPHTIPSTPPENPGDEGDSGGNTSPYEPPNIPTGTKPYSNLPPNDTNDDFILLNKKVITHKDTRAYRGTLIIKDESLKNYENAFEIKGGKEDIFYVGRDFYVGGNVHIQNHACLAVGGNLTVNGSFNFQGNTESDIIIMGDAYFLKMPTYKEKVNFHVTGRTFVGNPPREYESGLKNTDAINSSCFKQSGFPKPNPKPKPNPNLPNPSITPRSWVVDDSVNAEYK